MKHFYCCSGEIGAFKWPILHKKSCFFTGKKKEKGGTWRTLQNTIAPATIVKGNCGILSFFFTQEMDSCPRGKGWKEGRWYTDEEERVLGIWSNPSIHLPTHTTVLPIHSVPRHQAGIVKTASAAHCCPHCPQTPLSLAGGHQQVWCMCYFYNRNNPTFKTPKAAKQVTKFRRGEKRQKRGGAKPGVQSSSWLSHSSLWQQNTLARFSHLQFSHSVQHACPEEDSLVRKCQMKKGKRGLNQ